MTEIIQATERLKKDLPIRPGKVTIPELGIRHSSLIASCSQLPVKLSSRLVEMPRTEVDGCPSLFVELLKLTWCPQRELVMDCPEHSSQLSPGSFGSRRKKVWILTFFGYEGEKWWNQWNRTAFLCDTTELTIMQKHSSLKPIKLRFGEAYFIHSIEGKLCQSRLKNRILHFIELL